MRLFIAIELPKNMKLEILRMQNALRVLSQNGRFVPMGNMHITLSFLGETSDLSEATVALSRAAEGFVPFPLNLGKYGCFDNGGEKTSYIDIRGELNKLNDIYESLNAALYDNGFRHDTKKFIPHITLGRNIVHDDEATKQLVGITPALNASMSVNSIILFESVHTRNGMLYTPLHKEKFLCV